MRAVISLSFVTLLTLTLLATARSVQAESWQNGGNSLWSNPLNWDTNPFIPNASSAVFFDAVGSTTVDLGGASRDLFNLNFNFGAQGYTFSGNAGDKLNFSTFGSINANFGMAGPQTINSAIGLNGDAFTITNDDTTNLLTLGGDISLTSGTAGLLTVTGTGSTTINGAIASGAITDLMKTGTGTLTLGGANAYTGTTTILGGTLMTAADEVLPGQVVMGDFNLADTVNLNLGTHNETISSLVAQSNTANSHTITIGNGNTLTLAGSPIENALLVGASSDFAGSIESSLTISGAGGTFTFDNSSRNIVVAQPASTTAGTKSTLDMSGLGTFNATVENIYVGRATSSTGAANGSGANRTIGVMRLAHDQNTITATGANGIVVGGQTGNSISGNLLTLGTINNIGAAQWVVGLGRASGGVMFDSGLVNPTISIYGAGGPDTRTDIFLGDQRNASGAGAGTGGSSSVTGTMDFTGGTVTALIENLIVGTGAGVASSTRGRGNGVLIIDGANSNVNVNSLTISTNVSDSSTVSLGNNTNASTSEVTVNGGIFTVNSFFQIARNVDNSSGNEDQDLTGTFTLNNGTVTIGSVATPVDTVLAIRTSSSTGVDTATLNINGGSYTSNGNIATGTSGTLISTLSLAGGSLDMTGHDIGASGALITNLNFASGTLKNVNEINNGAGLTKTTAGTLDLVGAINFTGNVNLNDGTLNFLPSTTQSLGAGNLTVADGTTLGVRAFDPAHPAIVTTGAVSLGSSTGSTLNLTLAGNPTAPLINTIGSLSTGGTNTVNIGTTAGITSGVYSLIDYTGSIGGAGFGGLTLGTTPLRTTAASLVDNVANSSVDLNITIDSTRWNGDINAVWNINATNNWKEIGSGNSTTYLQPGADGEPVLFDDNAVGNFNVDVATPVNPVSITFNNSAKAYTLSGAGDLSSLKLIKNGANSATISTTGALNIPTIQLNGTGALVIDRADNPTISSAFIGTGKLQKAGTNTLTLDGNSTGFTGTVDIAAGTLALGSAGALGGSTTNIGGSGTLDLNGQTLVVGSGGIANLTGTGNVTAGVAGTLQISTTHTLALPVEGNATLAIAAPGETVTVTGGSNTYTGPTQLTSGTLALSGGDNRLPTGTTLAFNPNNAANAAATLDLGSNNQTISALTFPIGSGFNPPRAMTLAVNGTGTLTVNGPSDLVVGAGGTDSLDNAAAHEQLLDLSGLNNFVFDNSAQVVQFRLTGNRATKQTKVATVNFATNNTITAAGLAFGNDGGGAGGGLTTARLGQTNIWNVDVLEAGITRADVDIQFAPGLVNPSVKLRAADGVSPLPMFTIGENNDNSSSRTWDDVVDFSGGITDALIDTMVIGLSQPSGGTRDGHQNGTFILGAGNVTVTNLNIGNFSPETPGTSGTDTTMDNTGTFRLNNAGGTLNADIISLASVTDDVGDPGTKATTGTLDIQDGTVKANTITKGVYLDTGSGLTTATARVDFTGGTIENYTGQNMAVNDVNVRMLATTGTPTVNVTGSNTITFNAGTVVSDVGVLTKTGTGTLIYQGINTHGGTFVNEGLAKVEGSGTFSEGGILGTNGSGTADVNGTNQTVGTLAGNGGQIINSVASMVTLTIGGGDGGGGEYFGSISVGGGNPTGDYNMNGTVDAADFVLWKKAPGSYGGPGGYDMWRLHFGETGGGGAGDFTLVKTGLGATTLSGTNNYTGTTTIQAGALAFGTPEALYNNQQGSFAGFWNTTNIVAEADATLGFGVGGAGSFTEAQIASLHSSLGSVSGGFKPGSSLGINPAVASYAYSTAIGDAAGGTIMTGLTKMGPNLLTLSNTNTYSGNTQVAEGVLSVTHIGNVFDGVPSQLGKPPGSAQAAIRLGSSANVTGTLRYTGSGETTDRDFLAWGGAGANGAIESSGTGALVLTGNLYSANAGAKTLTLGGTNTGGNKVVGSIFDSADVVSLAKTGTGAWELPSANSYTGLTRVVEGTLKISGSHFGGSDYDIGDTAGLTATAILDGASASVSILDDLHVGYNGSTGTLTMNDGSLTVPDDFRIGVSGGTGTFTMHNGFASSGDNVIVGLDGGTGFFTMNNGLFTTSNNSPIQIGYEPGDTGTFTLNDGTINCDDWVVIGTFGGTGHGFQNGGDINCEPFVLAQDPGAMGDYAMTGGVINASENITIGQGGDGTMTFSNGTVTGAKWTIVGDSGTGQLEVSGTSTWNVGDNLYVGNNSGSTGMMTIQDNAYVNVQGLLPAYSGNVVVGNAGNGTLTMTGGTLDMTTGATGSNNSISYAAAIADFAQAQDGTISIGEGNGTGVVNFLGDALVNVSSNIIVGGAISDSTIGTGTLNIGDTATVHVGVSSPTGGDLIIGSPSASTGTVNLQGGLLDVAHTDGTYGGNIAAGGSASTAAFNFSGGTLKVRVWNAPGPSGGDLGNLVQSGAGSLLDITSNDTMLLQNSQYDLGAGTATIGGGHTFSTNGVLNSAGAGAINVGDGGGTAFLSAGANKINVDTLKLDNGDVTAAMGVTVATALSGNGTINNSVTMGTGANVSPGLSVGTLNFVDDLALDSTGKLVIEIDGNTMSDKINVTDILSLAGTLEINVIGVTPTVGQPFDILDWGSLSGTFSSLPLPANWDTSDLYTMGIVKFVALGAGSSFEGGAVPEPATLALLLLGAGGLAASRRERRRIL